MFIQEYVLMPKLRRSCS